MRRTACLCRWPAALAAAFLIGWLSPGVRPCMAQRAQAPPEEPVSEFGRRYDAFRFLFASAGFRLGTLEEFGQAPQQEWANWMIIDLGSGDPTFIRAASRFVSAGGSLLVATDRATQANALGVRVRPGPVWVPIGASAYRNLPFCPLVTRFDRSSPLFNGVEALALNDPGYLTVGKEDGPAVAWLPPDSFVGEFVIGPKPVVAQIDFNPGRAIVVADQSPFINEMILEPDAGNLLFARAAIDWLRAGRPAETVRVLFIEDSQTIENWVDPRFVSGDWSEPDFDLAKVLNDFLLEVEDEHRRSNWLNDLVLSGQRTLPRMAMRRLVPAIVSFLFALLLAWWLLRAWGNRAEKSASAEETGRPKAVLDQRRLELVERGAFAEPARQMARQFFTESFGIDDWVGKSPSVLVAGSAWMRWHVGWQVRRLWKRAVADPPRRVRRRAFFRLQREVARLEALVKQGALRAA